MLDTRPLRLPAFRRLFLSSLVTALGGQLTAFAVPLQLYRLTGSSLWVGLGSTAGLLPMVAAALLGGALADRVDRRRVLLRGNAGLALCSLLLWAQAAAGLRSPVLLLALVAAQQACFGANAAVRGAIAPRLVPTELLPAANALQTLVGWAGGIGGPLLAGVLPAVTGLGPLYLLDAAALVAALLLARRLPALPPAGGAEHPGTEHPGTGISRVGSPGAVSRGLLLARRRPARPPAAGAGHPDAGSPGVARAGAGSSGAVSRRLWARWRAGWPSVGGVAPRGLVREVGEGFRYLAGQRVLLAAYLADFTAMFFGMPVALFPQLAQQGPGPAAIGLWSAALSTGAVLAGLAVGRFGGLRRHGALVTGAVCVWGLAVAGFGLVRSVRAGAVLLAVGGAAIVVLSVFRKTILQSAATDGMRGRLQGTDTVIAAGGPRLAGLAHGAVGAAAGTGWAITGGGVLAVLAALGTAVAVPAFWRYAPPRAVRSQAVRSEAARSEAATRPPSPVR
ncbi:MFS transporter [Kitasatospora sp. LaBMicrA B282]|uniref:MFS transporter n=1 Tax=Kitasatospora sp. LaBMicrA B282 TaxID=3420949 RepID=UPI003D11B519